MATSDDDKNKAAASRSAELSGAPTGYAAGAALRRSLGSAFDRAKQSAVGTAARAAAPYARTLSIGAGFAGGLAGGTPSQRQTPATPRQPAAAPAAASAGGQQAQRWNLTQPGQRTPLAQVPQRSLPAAQNAGQPAAEAGTGAGSEVAGTFNGRTITRADADARARRLPTSSGPVVTGPGGGYAFASDGSRGAAPTPAAPAAEATTAPQLGPRRTLRGDLRGAEQERAAALEQVNNAIRSLEQAPSGLNSRGRRQMYQTLIGQRNALTGQRVDQATTLESQGAQLDNTAQIEGARLQQAATEGNANRTLTAADQAARNADRDAALDISRNAVQQVLTDTSGNASVIRGDGSLAPLTGADGEPFRPAAERGLTVSPDTEFRSLNDRLTQLQAFGRPEGAEGSSYDAEVARIQARMAQLNGTTAPSRAAPQPGAVVDGYRFRGGDPANQANWEKVN